MMQQVPILRQIYNKLNGTKIWATVLKNHPQAFAYDGMTKNNADGSISIKIFQHKSDTNIHIALTLGHELTHAIGIVNGSEAMWRNMIRADAGNIIINNFAVYQSEVGAYSWSASYSDSQSTYNFNILQSKMYLQNGAVLLRDFGK